MALLNADPLRLSQAKPWVHARGMSAPVVLEVVAHPLKALAQVRLPLRVGQSEESGPCRPEGRARKQGHPGLLQQAVRELALAEAGSLHVGEGVEGALGALAPHARHRVEGV